MNKPQTVHIDYAVNSQRLQNLLDCIRGQHAAISGHDHPITEQHAAVIGEIGDGLYLLNEKLRAFRFSLDRRK